MPEYRLSPSDFAFLWQECHRCFYLKYVTGFKRPGGPFPSIFGTIDLAMRRHYIDQRTELMSPDLHPGTMTLGEKWVHSAPIQLPGHESTLVIRGKLDAALTFDDGTYGVIDFKTSAIKPQSIRLYSRQLRSYTYALENPAPGKLHLAPVTKMGLLAFTPDDYMTTNPGQANLSGKVRFYEIKRNDASFMGFLDEVLTVLELPEPPAPDPKCPMCQYRNDARENGL